MKLKAKVLLAILFLACSGFYLSDNNPVEDIVVGIEKYFQSNYQEKVFVQTDADLYYSGENLWFSLRLLDARNHTPSKLSKVVHLKLFNEEGVELHHNKVLIDNGFGNSDILLSDTLSSGVYQIHAYTEWMKNFSQEFFFKKKIQVINKQIEVHAEIDRDTELDVSFFPEGGSFINGKLNKVGFKVINSKGLGVDISGVLLNDKDEVVDSIRTYKYGMGSFVLEPAKNRSYRIEFISNNNSYKFNLPNSVYEGIKMTINTTAPSKVSVELEVTKGYLKQLKKVLLVSHCRGNINYAAEGKATSNSIIDIPRSKLSDGINQITIFDQDGNPLLERLIFVRPKSEQNIQLEKLNTIYKQRTKVELDLKSLIQEEANVTVSVHDRKSIDDGNIRNYLLLKSDLKGHIENPEYYFQENDSALVAVDNLMLTQGWVRFNWAHIKNNHEETKMYSAEDIGPIFRGKLINKSTNKPVTDTLIVLSELGENPNYLFNRVNANEEFIFNLHKIYGRDQLYVNVYDQDSIDQFELVPYSKFNRFNHEFKEPILIDHSSINQYVPDKLKEKRILDNFRIYNPETSVYWKPTIKEEIFRVGQSLESPDYSVNPEEYIELNNLEEVVKEIVPGTTIRKVKGKTKIFVYEYEPLASAQRDIAPFNKKPATVFLNGVPIFNEEVLFNQLEWSNIKNIDVYIGQYDIADHKFYGFISITTKDIYTKNSMLAYATNVIQYEGLTVNKEFYSPKYDVSDPYADRTPDFRHLLYWKPNLKIKANETSSVSFYTSDVQGEFYITIEGISKSGKPIVADEKISVTSDLNQ